MGRFKVIYDDELNLGEDIDTYDTKAEAERNVDKEIACVINYYAERNIEAERKDYTDDANRSVTEIRTDGYGYAKWVRDYSEEY